MAYRLGIIVDNVAGRGQGEQVMLNFSIGRLLEAIKALVPSARICIPMLGEPLTGMNHMLQYPAQDITELPPMKSTRGAQPYYFRTRRAVVDFVRDVDLLLLRVPFQLPLSLVNLGKPKVVHVTSNPYEIVKASTDYRGAMKYLALRFAKHSEAMMRRLIAEPATRVVTNGAQLWELLECREGRSVVSSCLHRSEMIPRTSYTLNHPPRILFVGYLRPEKGVDTLLNAFTRVRSRRELKLTLVGASDRVSGAEEIIRRQIENNKYRHDITLTGMMNFGEPLFDLYRSHDLYVLPSLSEGTPRTLVEARAFGCPVIATNVGGVPSSVDHDLDGLLVEPGDDRALADSIELLLDDECLRTRLIKQGIKRSFEYTVENFAKAIVDELDILAAAHGFGTRNPGQYPFERDGGSPSLCVVSPE